jgi:hypothetical protein
MANAQQQNKAASAMQGASNETAALPSEALMKEAVSLVKANGEQGRKNALFGGKVMESGFSFRFVVSEAMKRMSIDNRSLLESIVKNASPLVAPARLVARGDMTEKEFALLSPKLAAVAFKSAGGAKGEGFEPVAWQAAYAEAKAEAEKPKEKKTPDTPPDRSKALTPIEHVTAIADAYLKDDLAAWEELAYLARARATAITRDRDIVHTRTNK